MTELTTQEQAALVLNSFLLRDELEDIMRRRNCGHYGRLRKREMADYVAGNNAADVIELERQRQLTYRLAKQALN